MIRCIPFKNFKEKINIVRKEERENRRVEVCDNTILSYRKDKGIRDFKNFKCNSCNANFRIVTTIEDIQYAICPRCGGINISYMRRKEEEIFERQIQ